MSGYKTVLAAGELVVRVCNDCARPCIRIVNGGRQLSTSGRELTRIVAKLDNDLQDETAETITIGEDIVLDQGEASAVLEVLKQDWRK